MVDLDIGHIVDLDVSIGKISSNRIEDSEVAMEIIFVLLNQSLKDREIGEDENVD